MISARILMIVAFVVVLTAGCTHRPVPNKELTVAAASSLQDVLMKIGSKYEKNHPEMKLIFTFAGSGTLQKQLEEGARVDLFISAGEQQMKALQKKGILLEGSEKAMVSNRMVVIVPKGSIPPNNLQELLEPDFKVIAMGSPDSVPAGAYAKEALISVGLMNQLNDRMVQGKDVREVLTWVETGNADAGFVYKTDAVGSKMVTIAFTLDSSAHKPIIYPAAVIKGSSQEITAKDFLTYLSGTEAQRLFENSGYTLIKKQ